MSNRNISDAVKSWIPNWLANRREKNIGFRFLWNIALMCDVFVDVMLQGAQAAWPGKGTPSALPYIGGSRGIARGVGEPDDDYAARLRAWLLTWQDAGGAESMVKQIQTFLGGGPIVRMVDRSGNWVTIAADGTVTLSTDTAWDWDSISNPENTGHWSDVWIVVYPTTWTRYGAMGADPAWLAAWGTYQNFGLGHEVTRQYVDGIIRILSTWKAAHVYLRAVIWSYDPALFVPGSLSTPGNPDGTWGGPFVLVAGKCRTPLNPNARYWIPQVVN